MKLINNGKPYQVKGIDRMITLLLQGKKGFLLADEMGLGKTFQVVKVNEEMLSIKGSNYKVLYIVPKSLIQNTIQEFNKFAPEIKVHPYIGKNKILTGNYNVLLTTYNTVLIDIKILGEFVFDLIILDEAHIIKNPNAEITKTIKLLKGKQKIAITGTPIENKVCDLFSILDFIKPNLFNSYYHVKINNNKDKQSLLNKLNPIFNELIICRKKTKTTVPLPPIIIKDVTCFATDKQKELYNKLEYTANLEYRDILRLNGYDGIRRVMSIGVIPSLDNYNISSNVFNTKEWVTISGKLLELKKILLKLAPDEKALVFSSWPSVLHATCKVIQQEFGLISRVMDGKNSIEERNEIVKDFQDPNTRTKVLLISYKVGGAGLNLTAANHVILLTGWWNQSTEEQAIARAYRMGQKRPVYVYRLIMNNNIELSFQQYRINKTKKNKEIIPIIDEEAHYSKKKDNPVFIKQLDIKKYNNDSLLKDDYKQNRNVLNTKFISDDGLTKNAADIFEDYYQHFTNNTQKRLPDILELQTLLVLLSKLSNSIEQVNNPTLSGYLSNLYNKYNLNINYNDFYINFRNLVLKLYLYDPSLWTKPIFKDDFTIFENMILEEIRTNNR